jgi:pimeloyl-ACP methyl ester carboxylesterase
VSVPALYIAGDRDFVVAFPGTDQLFANLKTFVPGLRKIQMFRGCGHWTQQERPNEVSAALVEFIRTAAERRLMASMPEVKRLCPTTP